MQYAAHFVAGGAAGCRKKEEQCASKMVLEVFGWTLAPCALLPGAPPGRSCAALSPALRPTPPHPTHLWLTPLVLAPRHEVAHFPPKGRLRALRRVHCVRNHAALHVWVTHAVRAHAAILHAHDRVATTRRRASGRGKGRGGAQVRTSVRVQRGNFVARLWALLSGERSRRRPLTTTRVPSGSSSMRSVSPAWKRKRSPGRDSKISGACTGSSSTPGAVMQRARERRQRGRGGGRRRGRGLGRSCVHERASTDGEVAAAMAGECARIGKSMAHFVFISRAAPLARRAPVA